MSLETLARDILAADAAVAALVKSGTVTRIYPLVLPQNPTFPALVYQGISRTVEYHHEGAGMAKVRLQVSSWALTYLEAKALAAAVRTALQDHDGVTAGGSALQDAAVVNETDLMEDVPTPTGAQRLFRVSTDFYVWAQDQAA